MTRESAFHPSRTALPTHFSFLLIQSCETHFSTGDRQPSDPSLCRPEISRHVFLIYLHILPQKPYRLIDFQASSSCTRRENLRLSPFFPHRPVLQTAKYFLLPVSTLPFFLFLIGPRCQRSSGRRAHLTAVLCEALEVRLCHVDSRRDGLRFSHHPPTPPGSRSPEALHLPALSRVPTPNRERGRRAARQRPPGCARGAAGRSGPLVSRLRLPRGPAPVERSVCCSVGGPAARAS